MPMPGAGDSYFYEWYVGLENVIRMLNTDSGISCVVFQHDEYQTIDDVVVEYSNGTFQMCYQVKHNIETAAPKSLTFGSMLDPGENKKCLFEAMYLGWKRACNKSGAVIRPVLFTNRKIHERRTRRHFAGRDYSAYDVSRFVVKVQAIIADSETGDNLTFTDSDLEWQWKELCNTLSEIDPKELVLFFKVFQIMGNERSLEEMKRSLVFALCEAFSCEYNIALELFGRLLVGLTEWTTTGRKSRGVSREDAYDALAIGEDIDDTQHRLAHPYPFFESRRSFCDEFVNQLSETTQKLIFLSGNPGAGKTSTVSFLQSEYNLFLLRYHTFRPISPEQHFYNADTGACTAENLWGTLLVELRKRLKGHLAEYHVPVCNKLLSIDEVRGHVMRLLGILGQAALANAKKEYICIDGIDHAARANIPVTFLSSLPLPSEIPDGICIILVGQPFALYQDQYPQWLATDTEVKNISIPGLELSDIKQLILARANQFSESVDELSDLIYQKTEGNNLSVVFAVEEIKEFCTIEDAVAKLQQSNIGADIQQYYNHIWAHMKTELSQIMRCIPFPESIVACPILLMNGRVNTRILATALHYGMGQSDWTMLLDRLFPLVIRTNEDGEYALFHNDFRVFLMGVINLYHARYKEIALSLAQYFLQNNEGIRSYILGIPLLQCAERNELIPQYFTPEYVINALAEGISYRRLDEFACLSYDAACSNRDYIGYRNTYLAVKTLYQHRYYFDYYRKAYKAIDHPEIETIDISEVRNLPINKENLDEYHRVLSLCEKMYLAGTSPYIERAFSLYHKWFDECTPLSFLPLCADIVSEESAWELRTTETGIFLQNWGKVAAELGIPAPEVNKDLSDCEWHAVLSFGEQYFTYCIQHQKYDLAIDAGKAGYVDQRTFSKKLEDIYYTGAANKFSGILQHVKYDAENPAWNMLALSMEATCDPSFLPDRSVLDIELSSKRIYDQNSFALILKAFLLGRIEQNSDDEKLISYSDNIGADIDASEKEKKQAVFLLRTSALLGKYYWATEVQSTKLEGYSEWLLSARLHRSLDYSSARKFLMFSLLNSKASQSMGKNESFIEALQVSLFEIAPLSMFYKSFILDYLAEQHRYDIIKEFIIRLYGDNCCNISAEEEKSEIHERFSPYGKLVEPDLMQQFSDQLKWDVVGYVGHKEYALKAPYDYFELITKTDPSRWNDLGKQLYRQSVFADRYDNRYSFDIENCIVEAAAVSGMADYWELRRWSNEFRLKPDHLDDALLGFIRNAVRLEDLQAVWILCCGIHSWYTQDDRYGAKNIYDACISRASEINVDFEGLVSNLTPEWYAIVTVLSNSLSKLDASVTDNSSSAERKKKISEFYSDLSVEESLDYLTTIEQSRWDDGHYSAVLEKVLACSENAKEHLTLFLDSFSVFLQGKVWTHGDYVQVITTLLTKVGIDAFWKFAETIGMQLSVDDYQTSTRNVQLLFKLDCHQNPSEVETLFQEELRTQQLWISGDNHFNIDYPCEKTAFSFAKAPQSFPEMALYILLEQVDTQNMRKFEAAIFAINLLGAQFPEIMQIIIQHWTLFSATQEESLLIVIAKWSVAGNCSAELQAFLLDMYKNCSTLPKKLYLHSILLHLGEHSVDRNTVSCTAPAISYDLLDDGVPDRDNYYRNFLSLIERFRGKSEADALCECLDMISPIEDYREDLFAEAGDCCIPAISTYPGEIFYSKERSGEWATIPLPSKKARLLPPEDPFLLTEMPRMVFNEGWFPEITVTSDGKRQPELTASDFHRIAHSFVDDDETVLAASLWYPFGHKDGAVYTEFCKIDLPIKMPRPNQFDFCIGNYGLLISEQNLDESMDTNLGTGGLSLFNRLCGSFRVYFGNCQLAPSSVWRACFGCEPTPGNPYCWQDRFGQQVLRFERIASPTREALREVYIRQPILFRWVCKKTWLETILQEKTLCLLSISVQEPYPG